MRRSSRVLRRHFARRTVSTQQIAADLGYTPPSFNGYDRVTDTDTAWQSNQNLGGASLTIDRSFGRGRLTAITGWRYWDWDPSNDRDFIGLPVTTVSADPSKQRQWTQEIRYTADINPDVNVVFGVFVFHQAITSTASSRNRDQPRRVFCSRRVQRRQRRDCSTDTGNPSDIRSSNVSAAVFGQAEWAVTSRLRLLPGLRFNYDDKRVDFDTQVYGGLQTTDPVLIALQRLDSRAANL